MTGKKAKWTTTQKLGAKQYRKAANPNMSVQQGVQYQAGAEYHSTAAPSPQSQITWAAESTVTTEREAAEVAYVRTETKAFYDASRAQGVSANQIMSQALRGKTGLQFHAAKMVIQSEKLKSRAAEFKLLFPEIPNVPDTLRQKEQNDLLKAAGYKNKKDMKYELTRRREAHNICTIDEVEDEGVVAGPTQGSKKRKHGIAAYDNF